MVSRAFFSRIAVSLSLRGMVVSTLRASHSSITTNKVRRDAAAVSVHAGVLKLWASHLCVQELLYCSICLVVSFVLQSCLHMPENFGSLQHALANLFVLRPMSPLTVWRPVPCTTTCATCTTLATIRHDTTSVTTILTNWKFKHRPW